MSTTATTSPSTLQRAALRAIDEREIRKHGPVGAVMRAPSVETMIRRAALVLFRDDVSPADMVTALGFWSLMHRDLAS